MQIDIDLWVTFKIKQCIVLLYIVPFFVAVQGYDISFLITNYHCEEMQKQKLIDFIVQFMEARTLFSWCSIKYVHERLIKGIQIICSLYFHFQDIDKEISELKMSVNTRGRLVATEFLKQFVWQYFNSKHCCSRSFFFLLFIIIIIINNIIIFNFRLCVCVEQNVIDGFQTFQILLLGSQPPL